MNIVEQLHDKFIEEARNSPILLNDLSNMEKYIAESYSGRSLIELIQNADDAMSKRFLFKRIDDNSFLIANDGRVFDENDLMSLCRSGSSTKKRSNNNIGYRGIGFKSVVNYSELVHINSGDIKTTFSKKATKSELPNSSSVPLIRVPHQYKGEKYNNIIDSLKNDGYTTFFIFETFNSIISEEIQIFDSSCMLFLNHIEEIIFIEKENQKTYLTKKVIINNKIDKIQFIGDEESEWMIFHNENDICTKLAFRTIEEKAVPTSKFENVIHSFMPTQTSFSIPIKINANFSTDPSRTKVVLDDDTVIAINQVAELLKDLTESIIKEQNDKYGFIKILNQAKLDPLKNIKGSSISDEIIEKYIELSKEFINKQYENSYFQGNIVTDKDFYTICENFNIKAIGSEEEKNIEGITTLLKLFEIKELPLEKILKVMETEILSFDSRINVLQKVIDSSRFGIDFDMMNLFKKSKTITFERGIIDINSINNNDKIDDSFKGALLEKYNSLFEIEWFLKKMNIKIDDVNKNRIEITNNQPVLKTNPNLNKWRSAEENVTSVLKSIPGVIEAIDVSSKNLGYDIDLLLEDGTHEYYEVKSVNYLGDSFTMTNNEFSSAVQYKDKYNLAIFNIKDNKISICIINDPIKTLQLSKRVTRWEWYCTSYNGKIINYDI